MVVTISKLLVHIFSAFPFLHINYGPVLSVCVCVSVFLLLKHYGVSKLILMFPAHLLLLLVVVT